MANLTHLFKIGENVKYVVNDKNICNIESNNKGEELCLHTKNLEKNC